MKGLWGSFKSSFIDPLSEKLFGKKGKNGYKEDGLLAGSQNKIKEAWHAVTLRLTGKSYEDSEGKTHTEETDGVKSTLSIVKDAMGNIGESIRFRLFGDKKEDNKDKTKKKPAIISGLVDSLQQGLIGWKTALFGKDDKTVEESVSKMKKNAMDSIPSAGAGAITGGLLGGAAGGSLLGTLIGGPVGGAILGIGASFIKRSNTFQNYVFGPEVKDEDGNTSRIGGLVSKKTQDLLKSPGMKKSMVGGAALGLIKNVALGSSGGLLGSLVGGPVAGLVIGGGLGMLRRSEMFQTFLYGDEKKGKTGLIQHFKNIFKGNKDKSKDKDTEGIKKRLGMGATGAAAGGITAALISKVGLMGAMLTPAGPIGGAALGMAVGLSAGSKKFSKWLFGEKDEETGKRKGGMVGKLGNFMHVEVMMPLKDKMISIGDDMKNVIEHKVLDTIRITIEPIDIILSLSGIITSTCMKLPNLPTIPPFRFPVSSSFSPNNHFENFLLPALNPTAIPKAAPPIGPAGVNIAPINPTLLINAAVIPPAAAPVAPIPNRFLIPSVSLSLDLSLFPLNIFLKC
jgi:hypothetical protein